MTADDEGDDSSRLLSRQGPDLQDGGASSETRDDIFASGVGNRVGRPKSRSGAGAQLVLVWRPIEFWPFVAAYSSRLM